ncbi:hypothetical protein [Chitinophaga pinensis]|uniref:Uncharacterized protein n=1 Tax=Chitinophaga pinensis TaxID=79329 RepID=A0A5C6LST9_9BACT|nr:hypothetical protein [Chitinophaga pinensis]TWV99529.1 hypothetical protein FEF09_16190 [Chitinophaga pinensis]
MLNLSALLHIIPHAQAYVYRGFIAAIAARRLHGDTHNSRLSADRERSAGNANCQRKDIPLLPRYNVTTLATILTGCSGNNKIEN